jgi:hypothetical protein
VDVVMTKRPLSFPKRNDDAGYLIGMMQFGSLFLLGIV